MRSVQISRQLLPPLQTFFLYGFSIGFIDVWSLPNNHPAALPPPAGTQLASVPTPVQAAFSPAR